MKLIVFVLVNCAYEITSLKLPLTSVSKNEDPSTVSDESLLIQQENEETLNTRNVETDYGSYMPTDYGNLNFVSNWVDSITRMLPNYSQPQSYYNTQTYFPFSTDYSQEQWSSQPWQYDWSQYPTNSYPNQNLYADTIDPSQWVGTYSPSYYTDQNPSQQGVTKKISTVFNAGDSQEIKHKVIISPEYPDGTGYISIGSSGNNKVPGGSSKDGKVYYRF